MIGTNLLIGNGPLLEQAPAMAAILRDLVGGRTVKELRQVLLEDLQPNGAVRGILPDALLCERSRQFEQLRSPARKQQ